MDALSTQWDENYIAVLQQTRKYVTQIQNDIAVDGLGRITALVNAEAIIQTGLTTSVDEMADNPPPGVIMPVVYTEDIPTIYGIPIWEHLEGEPLDHYDLFKQYRNMRREEKAQRNVYRLSLVTGIPVVQLELLRQVYHWQQRVQAFDAYEAQERAIVLALRQQEVEGRHATVAKDLFNIGAEYLRTHKDMLNPKTAIQMMDLAIKLERISAGLADGRISNGTSNAPTVNITNNVPNAQTASINTNIGTGTGSTGDLDADKQRLAQVLNIMHTIGALDTTPIVVDGESKEVDPNTEI